MDLMLRVTLLSLLCLLAEARPSNRPQQNGRWNPLEVPENRELVRSGGLGQKAPSAFWGQAVLHAAFSGQQRQKLNWARYSTQGLPFTERQGLKVALEG